jgi:hypothetical protein
MLCTQHDHFSISEMDVTPRKYKKRKFAGAQSAFTPVVPSTAPTYPPQTPQQRRVYMRTDFGSRTVVCPPPFIPPVIRVVVPLPLIALPASSAPIRDPELCRENYAVIMRKMFYPKAKQERRVAIQMIKKPNSMLNIYFSFYGEIILPVLELPTTYTVWIVLELNRKRIRAPLDHFRIVN